MAFLKYLRVRMEIDYKLPNKGESLSIDVLSKIRQSVVTVLSDLNTVEMIIKQKNTDEEADMTAGMEVDYADAEASQTQPVQASALRKNGHVLMKDYPCKIVDMSSSKTGKHGHAKVQMVGLDVFTGKKYEEMSLSSYKLQVPNVSRAEYLVVYMNPQGYMALMDDAGRTRHDFKIAGDDEAMRKNIQDKLDKNDDKDVMVTLLKAMDREMIMNVVVK